MHVITGFLHEYSAVLHTVRKPTIFLSFNFSRFSYVNMMNTLDDIVGAAVSENVGYSELAMAVCKLACSSN